MVPARYLKVLDQLLRLYFEEQLVRSQLPPEQFLVYQLESNLGIGSHSD